MALAFALSPARCGPRLTVAVAAAAVCAQILAPPAPPECQPPPSAARHAPLTRVASNHVRRAQPSRLSDTAVRIRAPRFRRRAPRAQAISRSVSAASDERLRRVANEAWSIFQERYVDNPQLDWKRMKNRLDRRPIRNETELQESIEWMLAEAHDEFTRFLPRSELDSMKDDIDGEMCGVGIVFDAEAHGWRRTKRVVVKEVVKNSPAADAGLSRGDEITAIDMASIRRMSVDEATNRLLGGEGNKVSISFIRCADALELSVTLTRRRFSVPTISGEAVVVPGVGRVGFVQVREFAVSTALQARRAVRRLLSSGVVDAFVIDLRGNSGGLVDQAVEFAKIFLPRDNIIVRFVGRDNEVTTESSAIRWFCRQRVRVVSQPVIVLVDESTASSSELVAAALRDNCRAVIIGSPTYGKGSVQAIAQLSDGAGVAVTVARYRTPRDKGIEVGRGLKPDMFQGNMALDSGVVNQLFGRQGGLRGVVGGARVKGRMNWVRTRLVSCAARR
jgi:carboxyl-terminal processing protease